MSTVKPLCIDLFCGLGGWAEGFLAEGWDVVGFDIERHRYASRTIPERNGVKAEGFTVKLGASRTPGDSKSGSFNTATEAALKACPLDGGIAQYPGQLVLQDILTLHGSQFRKADCIVASPPCQTYSWMAMPWSRAKAKAAWYREHELRQVQLNALFNACFRLQREASAAAGRHIPMVVENVVGAQKWVGRAAWHFGSFYLWGDVPVIMPRTLTKRMKSKVSCVARRFDERIATTPEEAHALHYRLPLEGSAIKQHGSGPGSALNPGTKHGEDWFSGYGGGFGWDHSQMRQHSSRSPARKAASALIAKIPFDLSSYIASYFYPYSRGKLGLSRESLP